MSLIANEYDCPEHGRFCETVERSAAPDAIACPICGASSPWCISAPFGRVKRGEVVRGKSDERPSKNWLDTRDLGEGQSHEEYEATRKKIRDDRRRKELKELMS